MKMSDSRFIIQGLRQNLTEKHRNLSRLQQKNHHKVNPKEITDLFYHPVYTDFRIFPIGFCADDAKRSPDRKEKGINEQQANPQCKIIPAHSLV